MWTTDPPPSVVARRRPGPWPRLRLRLGRARRGFTLLEVLVAMAVLAITLVTLYESFISTVRINTSTRGLWKAMIYANNELARIERSPSPSVSVQQGDFPPDDPMAGYSWRREVADEQPFPNVTVRKVLLELTWSIGGVPQSYRAQIYVQSQ
ncbi:MAG TPA: prepilin-type N-terminal cleavage/methylation domain-containing protein [bacterium]|nr:prepilin-type N-terminal cleavage/methylation domain-containing protein [bacterium]